MKGLHDILEGTDYRGPAGPVTRLHPWEPVGADKPGNHGDEEGGCVLRMDGSVMEYVLTDAMWQDCVLKLSP